MAGVKQGNYLDGVGKDFCGFCKLKRTPEGHDGCIGEIESVKNACCGHGEDDCAYVQFDHDNYNEEPNKCSISGETATFFLNSIK